MKESSLLLYGWGRWPRVPARVVRPRTQAELEESFRGGDRLLGRGLGRSYGDASLLREGRVVQMEARDRFLAFDESSGILRAEAGVTIGELIETFLPRGWFPPVVPGTQFVTLGGCVAADVHGKNHHRDGAFSNHVRSLRLVRGDGRAVECGPKDGEAYFRATAGGMGLTGVILEVELQLRRVASSELLVSNRRCRDFDELLRALDEADRSEYSVAWVDAAARASRLGRGLVSCAEHAPSSSSRSRVRLGAARRLPLRLPSRMFSVPFLRWGNEAYFRAGLEDESTRRESIERFFFPLDRWKDWPKLYGRNGFTQYQFAIPETNAPARLREILMEIVSRRMPCPLAVLKRFGPGNGLLSFPIAGYTLALDFPLGAPGLFPFLDELDRWVADAGGRVYLAKDARLGPELFRRMYPETSAWQRIRREMDPGKRFGSELSKRLRLEEDR